MDAYGYDGMGLLLIGHQTEPSIDLFQGDSHTVGFGRAVTNDTASLCATQRLTLAVRPRRGLRPDGLQRPSNDSRILCDLR